MATFSFRGWWQSLASFLPCCWICEIMWACKAVCLAESVSCEELLPAGGGSCRGATVQSKTSDSVSCYSISYIRAVYFSINIFYWRKSKEQHWRHFLLTSLVRLHPNVWTLPLLQGYFAEVPEFWGLSKPSFPQVHNRPQTDFLQTSTESAWGANFTGFH